MRDKKICKICLRKKIKISKVLKFRYLRSDEIETPELSKDDLK